MMLLIGQPLWQNGIPQSMQRAPCFSASSSASVRMNSRKLRTRSGTGSATSWIRCNSMNPVILPTSGRLALLGSRRGGLCRSLLRVHFRQRAFVLVRKYLDEATARRIPIVEDRERARAPGEPQVPLDQLAGERLVRPAEMLQSTLAGRHEILFRFGLQRFSEQRFESHHRRVATRSERAIGVVDISDSAAHAGGEVPARGPQHDDGAARHVFAAVIAAALDNRPSAPIAHTE